MHSSQKPLSQAGITGDGPIHQMCPFLFPFNCYFIIVNNYFGAILLMHGALKIGKYLSK